MGTNKFAEMLKYYLMMNNKTQSDLVNDLGFDKSTVSNWCAGLRVPKVDVIIDIASYLHVNVGDLIEDNRNDDTYYLDDNARDMAQFLYENPDYKVLFDASRKVKREDIQFVKEMIDRMSNKGDD
jgi:transcriptional regulator with XRE-family HTH domain